MKRRHLPPIFGIINARLLTVEHEKPCTFINIGGFECINHKFTRNLLLQILINLLVKKTENRWIEKAARIPWAELEKEYTKKLLNKKGNIA